MLNNKIKIGILGATGHIAKGLIYGFQGEEDYELHLFGRSRERMECFINVTKCRITSIQDYYSFYDANFDVIINCVGIGDPAILRESPELILNITEEYDNLIINYLKTKNDAVLYINLSSGAVFGSEFSEPVNDGTLTKLNMNYVSSEQFYSIAKIHSEAKHRALAKFNIIDLRIFGYFSRFMELEKQFFLSDVLNCLKTNKILYTNPTNIIRDYLHFKDLVDLIKLCIVNKGINDAYDVYSKKPITKFEIIDFYKTNYGLEYIVEQGTNYASITGNKNLYFSNNYKARRLGYNPNLTSLECIIGETQSILGY